MQYPIFQAYIFIEIWYVGFKFCSIWRYFALFGNEHFVNDTNVMHWRNYCNMRCNDQWQPFAMLLLDGFCNIPLIPQMQFVFLWTYPWAFEPQFVQLCYKNTLFLYQSRKPNWPLLQPPTPVVMKKKRLLISTLLILQTCSKKSLGYVIIIT